MSAPPSSTTEPPADTPPPPHLYDPQHGAPHHGHGLIQVCQVAVPQGGHHAQQRHGGDEHLGGGGGRRGAGEAYRARRGCGRRLPAGAAAAMLRGARGAPGCQPNSLRCRNRWEPGGQSGEAGEEESSKGAQRGGCVLRAARARTHTHTHTHARTHTHTHMHAHTHTRARAHANAHTYTCKAQATRTRAYARACTHVGHVARRPRQVIRRALRLTKVMAKRGEPHDVERHPLRLRRHVGQEAGRKLPPSCRPPLLLALREGGQVVRPNVCEAAGAGGAERGTRTRGRRALDGASRQGKLLCAGT